MRQPSTLERILPWILRVGWVAVLAAGDRAIDGATAGHSSAVRDVATVAAGVVWLVGVAAMAFGSVVTLTATRVVVPLALPVSMLVWAAGADAIDGALFFGSALITALVAASGDLGRGFVQASAYGEERRFPLRPPPAYLLASALTWAVCATALITAPLVLAARGWVVGAALAVLAVIGPIWSWPRWHRLSRRWLVIVPVGVVVHDQLVLAETLMLRRPEVAALHLARADTGAADLTGPAAGHAIEIVTTEPVTVIFAASPGQPRGRAIHMTACLVAPSRPGAALAAAADRQLPVG